MTNNNHKIIFGLLILVCFFQTGCATLGDAAGGLATLTATLVKLPFDVLSKVLDIVGKLPKPPPGVF